MSSRSHFFLFILLILLLFAPASNGLCDELNNLINIQQKFAASIKPQFEAYYQELSELEKSLAGESNATGLTEIRNEIVKVEGQLTGITTLINYKPEPAVKPVTEIKPEPEVIPEPEPVKIHKPETYISNTQGIAGLPKFSKNNVYSFNLPATGKTSSLAFYATGRRSTDTKGLVWLVKPTGEKLKVAKWKGKDFKKSAKEIESYKNLNAITEDISDMVNVPGLYKIEFEWTGGIDPLVIYRVELTS